MRRTQLRRDVTKVSYVLRDAPRERTVACVGGPQYIIMASSVISESGTDYIPPSQLAIHGEYPENHAISFRMSTGPAHNPPIFPLIDGEMESSRTTSLSERPSKPSVRLCSDTHQVRSPARTNDPVWKDSHEPKTEEKGKRSKIVAPPASPPKAPTGLLSELHMSLDGDKYTVVCAAPGMKRDDLHYQVDPLSRILRVSNAPEPENREILTYLTLSELDVHEYPSSNAPIVGQRQPGNRLRGYAPVHFWVGLLHGDGWVRLDLKNPALRVLGREDDGGQLSAHEATNSSGFARFIRLPKDANLNAITAGIRSGFFEVTVPRHMPPTSPRGKKGSPITPPVPRAAAEQKSTTTTWADGTGPGVGKLTHAPSPPGVRPRVYVYTGPNTPPAPANARPLSGVGMARP